MASETVAAFSGRRGRGAAAKSAVFAVVRLAGDKLAAAGMRLRGPGEESTPPEQLAAEWRKLAAAEGPPSEDRLEALFSSTFAGWGQLSLGDRILHLDAWGFIQQRHPTVFASLLPRPLMRRMERCLWGEDGAASVFQLNMCAVRAQPFMTSPVADLARSILDAAIHACAERVRGDYKLAAAMGPVLSMAPHASRTATVQAELHLLRRAAADAVNPLDEAIYRRIAWTKHAFACDSFTARDQVAASLARDSVQLHGGNLRATFIKAFGCAPDELGLCKTPPPATGTVEAAEDALEEWRRGETRRLAAAAAAAGIEGEEETQTEGAEGGGTVTEKAVERSGVSVCTVHSDGRSEAAPSP